MQGTWVRALVQEDTTCHRATKPVCHNYWACALEPMSHNYWALVPQLVKPAHLEPVLHNKRSHRNQEPRTATKSSPRSPQLEKAPVEQRRPNTAKINKSKKRIRLPVQGTRVRALVWEDPTCRRATKSMHHNYWACALEPASHNYWSRVPQLLKPACLEPVLCNKRSHCNEKPAHRNEG